MLVVGKDNVCPIGNNESGGVDPALGQAGDLVEQHLGIYNDAVADDLRSQGFRTVPALADGDPVSEARRLACSHALVDGTVTSIDAE